ncbi:hypothetical protein Hanom_Chr09g00778481 [Helianthus anomalus]
MRNFLFFTKKPSHLREECRHQFRVLGEFKRGVDVTHENWLCVREGTPLLGECPIHPLTLSYSSFWFSSKIKRKYNHSRVRNSITQNNHDKYPQLYKVCFCVIYLIIYLTPN